MKRCVSVLLLMMLLVSCSMEHTHSFDEVILDNPPTCTEGGVKTCRCQCGETETETFSSLGHDIKIVEAKTPTCISVGWESHEKCSRCDYRLSYVEIPRKEHVGGGSGDDTEWRETSQPTYFAKGVETQYCTICNESLGETRETDFKDLTGFWESDNSGGTTYTLSFAEGMVSRGVEQGGVYTEGTPESYNVSTSGISCTSDGSTTEIAGREDGDRIILNLGSDVTFERKTTSEHVHTYEPLGCEEVKNTDGGYLIDVGHTRETSCTEHSRFHHKSSHTYSGTSGEDGNTCSLCGAREYFKIQTENLTYYVEGGSSITLPPLPDGSVFWGISDSLKEENTVFKPTAEENAAKGLVNEEGIRADVLFTDKSTAEWDGYVIYAKRKCETCKIYYSGDKCPSPYTFGQTVYYGTYPANHEIENRRGQKVPWQVLSIDHDKSVMMVVAKDVLERREWGSCSSLSGEKGGAGYSMSEIKAYLGYEFISDYGLEDTGITYAFLLSGGEVKTFKPPVSRVAYYYDGYPCAWFLRDDGFDDLHVSTIGMDGSYSMWGAWRSDTSGVRPAFYVKYL